jgi:hypothetical protein
VSAKPPTAARPRRARRRRVRAVTAAMAVAVLGGAVVLRVAGADQGAPACRPAPVRSSLVPAYVHPDRLAGVPAALARHGSRPALLVLNPANGPGQRPDAGYRRVVADAHRAGTYVLGYVRTDYGARDLDAAEADVDRYGAWYGVDGVFLDETSHDDFDLHYYRGLAAHARSAGAHFVALNPGGVPARAYLAIADVVVSFEGPYAEYAHALAHMPEWLRQEPPERIAHLIYGASRAQALKAIAAPSGAGYLYFTDGSLPNPWGSLASYLGDAETALRGECP